MSRSIRRFSTLAVPLAVAAILVPVASAQPRALLPTLYVEYAMNCTFTITDDNSKRVTSIAPGKYQVEIDTPVTFGAVDLSGINDMTACKSYVQFQITVPASTSSARFGDGDSANALLTETFQAGATYTAQDLNQPAVTRTVFTTTASGSAVAPANPYVPGAITEQEWHAVHGHRGLGRGRVPRRARRDRHSPASSA